MGWAGLGVEQLRGLGRALDDTQLSGSFAKLSHVCVSQTAASSGSWSCESVHPLGRWVPASLQDGERKKQVCPASHFSSHNFSSSVPV